MTPAIKDQWQKENDKLHYATILDLLTLTAFPFPSSSTQETIYSYYLGCLCGKIKAEKSENYSAILVQGPIFPKFQYSVVSP